MDGPHQQVIALIDALGGPAEAARRMGVSLIMAQRMRKGERVSRRSICDALARIEPPLPQPWDTDAIDHLLIQLGIEEAGPRAVASWRRILEFTEDDKHRNQVAYLNNTIASLMEQVRAANEQGGGGELARRVLVHLRRSHVALLTGDRHVRGLADAIRAHQQIGGDLSGLPPDDELTAILAQHSRPDKFAVPDDIIAFFSAKTLEAGDPPAPASGPGDVATG